MGALTDGRGHEGKFESISAPKGPAQDYPGSHLLSEKGREGRGRDLRVPGRGKLQSVSLITIPSRSIFKFKWKFFIN